MDEEVARLPTKPETEKLKMAKLNMDSLKLKLGSKSFMKKQSGERSFLRMTEGNPTGVDSNKPERFSEGMKVETIDEESC
jgi:hypothetical protein